MLSPFVSWYYMCYCCNYYAGWSICDQGALVTIRTWTYMVEQRRGHGPNQIIKQHNAFYYFNSPANLEYSSNFSLSSFCLWLCVFLSFAVIFKFRLRESYEAYATSRYLILARRAAVATLSHTSICFLLYPCIQYSHLNRASMYLQGARKDRQDGVHFSSWWRLWVISSSFAPN